VRKKYHVVALITLLDGPTYIFIFLQNYTLVS